MDATTQLIVSSLLGQTADLIVYEEGLTKVFRAEIKRVQPLQLLVRGEQRPALRTARRAMLIGQAEGVSLRGEGHIDAAHWTGSGTSVDVVNTHWEVLDRRRHKRYNQSLKVRLKMVTEEGENTYLKQFEGETKDISLTGANVVMSEAPVAGSLVSFELEFEDRNIGGLALVTHLDKGGAAGLHFVEFFLSGASELGSYLGDTLAA